MPKFVVMWKYASSYVDGTLKAGEVVELSEGTAEMLNKDSPGVLVPFTAKGAKTAKGKKGQTRMVVEGMERGEEGAGVMTTENFGAVRMPKHRKGRG